MPRFFRRFAEGVFDVEDLKSRTEELAHFIDAASDHYEFSKKRLIAVGYSNGANIAASLILLHPHYLAAAVLFRPMVPFAPDLIRDFGHLSLFIGAGPLDTIVASDQVQELGAISRLVEPTRPFRGIRADANLTRTIFTPQKHGSLKRNSERELRHSVSS